MKKLTFYQSAKKFFYPARHDPWLIIKPFIRSMMWAFFIIYTVEIFKYATTLIQNNDFQKLQMIIWIFTIVLVVYCIINYYARNLWRATMVYEWLKFFQKDWMSRFFRLDNTEVEKIWTWKLISIMDQGFRTWVNMFWEFIYAVPMMIIIWIYSFWQIWQVWWLFSLLISHLH